MTDAKVEPETETNADAKEVNNNEEEKDNSDEYVCSDPVILDAFSDTKTAVLTKRTDIVRQILSAAQQCKFFDFRSRK